MKYLLLLLPLVASAFAGVAKRGDDWGWSSTCEASTVTETCYETETDTVTATTTCYETDTVTKVWVSTTTCYETDTVTTTCYETDTVTTCPSSSYGWATPTWKA